ncbi:MAG: HD domain-containing protein [Nitrospinae bacterium]|nr:HD domain-containing protein [Nitrospinota bacterium]
MTDSEETEFKSITRAFFQKEWKDGFDIFYEVRFGDRKKYIKFAKYDPGDFSRLDAILQEKHREVFYIKETDLYKYYKFNILKHLLLGLVQDKPPVKEVFQRVVPVATRILQDYLEIPASDRFLDLLDEIPKVLAEAIGPANLPFHDLFSITLKENATHVHCVNVGLYCLCLGRELNMNREDREALCLGGLLADIGKKYIPKDVMFKEQELTDEDMQSIRRHPALGRQALNDLKRYFETVLLMAGEHHESFDGTGYPMGVAGEKINTAARICKIMDVFNALTSRRSYHEVLTPIQALTLMKEKIGEQFDPQLLNTFIQYTGK